jgi:hypothetical protein
VNSLRDVRHHGNAKMRQDRPFIPRRHQLYFHPICLWAVCFSVYPSRLTLSVAPQTAYFLAKCHLLPKLHLPRSTACFWAECLFLPKLPFPFALYAFRSLLQLSLSAGHPTPRRSIFREPGYFSAKCLFLPALNLPRSATHFSTEGLFLRKPPISA